MSAIFNTELHKTQIFYIMITRDVRFCSGKE